MMSGLDQLICARPEWTMVAPASTRVSLEGRWLLHAGPPYARGSDLPLPVLASAVLACIHEKWASTEDEAEALVRSGAIRIESAQLHRCVTPLAALVSPATTVIVVEDAHGACDPVIAPLGTTGGPDLRFGTRDSAIIPRLSRRDGEEAATLSSALDSPIDLIDIALAGVQGGDDLHNRTTAATQELASELRQRWSASEPASRERGERLLAALGTTPLYFLTFWMAAAKLMLSAAEHEVASTLVTRMAGNGQLFGLSLAARPDVWFTVPASAPAGSHMATVPPGAQALGAIGDSAVIDALGFGGQALQFAAEPREALLGFLPAELASLPAAILSVMHPAFGGIGARVGLDAERVVAGNALPVVTLGMVERTGTSGLLGRGVYRPPLELFEKALNGLND